MKKSESNNKIYIDNFWVIIFVFVFLIICLFYSQSEVSINIKISKQRLVKFYQVDKKTFNKWVKYFGVNIFPDLKTYNCRRKLTFGETCRIVFQLGCPHNFPIMTKKQIVEKADGSYRSLRKSIQVYPSRFGISSEAFASLNKFPPNISHKILKQYD